MKKGLRIFCALSLLFSVKSFSQTNVAGRLTKNTTWTADGSPYIILANLEVPNDITLTIEPGVRIERSSKTEIIVNGAIIAAGSTTDSIFFKTDDLTDISTPPYLEFTKCDLSQSTLRFLSFSSLTSQGKNIRLGGTNESSASVKNSGTLSIARSNLSDGNIVSHGFNSGVSMNLDSCFFDSSTIHCLESYSEKIMVTNSTIINSTELADELSYGIIDSNCTVTNTIVQSGANTSVSVLASTVKACVFNIPGTATLFMSHDTVSDSPVFGSPGGIINIDASQMEANNSDTTLYPKINSVPYLITAFQANITNTVFSGVSNVDAIAINGTGGDTTTTIAHNTFSKFGDGVTVYDYSYQMHIDSNNFAGINTYDIINYSTKNFNAVYDYYSLQGGQTPDDVIYDRRDNPAYGFVNYIPYATDPVLPVHLISFTGVYRNGQVVLNWQTANEVNTLQYGVQRLVNGNYQDIGTVSAKGNSSNSYSFIPISLTGGVNVYRLKMIDKDGSYTYSVSVSVAVSGSSLVFTVYPNPSTHYIVVNHAQAETQSSLILADASGKTVTTIIVAKGDIQNTINVSGLAKGTYQLIWMQGNAKQSKTILVQ